MKKILMPIAAKVKNLIFPPRCPGCDRVLGPAEKSFCRKCSPKVHHPTAPVCEKCGKSISETDKKGLCPDCEKRKHYFNAGRGIYEYSGVMKKAMYRFKYSNRRCYADIFADDGMEILGEWIREINPQVIVPVPTHEKKKRLRGYNQAESLAKAIGERTGIPVAKDLVKRKSETAPMKSLSREMRRENLKNAFIIGKSEVQFNCVLIVDDIYTTGATMDAVAKCLREAGVSGIYAVYACVGAGLK